MLAAQPCGAAKLPPGAATGATSAPGSASRLPGGGAASAGTDAAAQIAAASAAVVVARRTVVAGVLLLRFRGMARHRMNRDTQAHLPQGGSASVVRQMAPAARAQYGRPMRRREGWGIVPRVDPLVLDGLIALVFVVIAQVDIWTPWGDNGQKVSFDGPRWLSAAILLTGTVPFVWRRRAPLVTAGAFAAAVVLDVTLVSQTALFFGEFIPMLVATYSVAAYAPRGRALLGVGMTGTAVLVVTLAVDELRTVSEVPFELAVVGAVWSVGRAVHRQRTRVDALREHADGLERRREQEARAAVGLERTRIARELHDVIAHSGQRDGRPGRGGRARSLDARPGARARAAAGDPGRRRATRSTSCAGCSASCATTSDEPTLAPQPGLDALDALVEQLRARGPAGRAARRGPPRHAAARRRALAPTGSCRRR